MNNYEFSPRESINYIRGLSPGLCLPLPGMAIVSTFGILGALLSLKQSGRSERLLLAFILAYVFSLMPITPMARYRLPLAVLFLIPAGYFAAEYIKRLKEKDYRHIGSYSLLAIPLLAFTAFNPMESYLSGFDRPAYHEGVLLYRQGNYEKAVAKLSEATLKDPHDADIYKKMGDTYVKLGKVDKALFSYEKALSVEPDFPEALNGVGACLAMQDKYEEAAAIFIKVLENFPDESVEAHINLGTYCEMKSEYKRAAEEYERALLIENDNIQALSKLKNLYSKTGNDKLSEIEQRLNSLTKNKSYDSLMIK